MNAVGFLSRAEAFAVGRIQITQMPKINGRAGILLCFMADRSLGTIANSLQPHKLRLLASYLRL
jgi:hypothetical protein